MSEMAPPSSLPSEGRFLAGVSPRNGAFLFRGWTLSRSGEKEWYGPLVEERDERGKVLGRYYDWRAPLAFQPTIDLTAMAGIARADYLPKGNILIGAPSQLGRSVLGRNPVDITLPAGRHGILADELITYGNRHRWGARPRYSMARFDPERPDDCAYGYWVGVSKQGRAHAKEGLTLDGLRALDGDHIAVWGMSGGAVLSTFDVKPVAKNVEAIARWKRKPDTPYLTLFSRDFAGVLWSGLLPRCRVSGIALGPRGVLVASTCRAPWKTELYEPLAAPGARTTFGGGYADGHILLLEVPK